MSEKDLENIPEEETRSDNIDQPLKRDLSIREFAYKLHRENISSSSPVRAYGNEKDIPPFGKAVPEELKSASADSGYGEKAKDPIFTELAEPKLPNIPKENRARLQMQSPTRLYFYWSVKSNPFQTLGRAFGGKTSYRLIAKLVNLTRKTEELFPVDAEGSWWFNVDPDCNYLAEIGFYASNRPYIRVMFSNQIRTPRRSPSKRTDYTPSFTVNAFQFAEVLDVAGYERDAFEVAVAGDDSEAAETATGETYFQLVGKEIKDSRRGSSDEIRFVLLALAAGGSLEDLRNEISPDLYNELIAELGNIDSEVVLKALKENFDIFSDEVFEEVITGTAVFGASLVNFPKEIRKRNVPKSLLTKVSKLTQPDSVSSHSVR